MNNSSNADIQKHKPHTDRVERFETLAPGQFWTVARETSRISELKYIDVGEILLITAINYIDNAPHTVIIRYHPTKPAGEARFLVNDFLGAFEHVTEEEAKADRSAQMQEVQALIGHEQDELVKATSDVQYLDKFIERDMPKPPGEVNLPMAYEALGTDVAKAIHTQKLSALMSPSLTSTGIEQIKSTLSGHKDTAVRRADWMKKKTNRIGEVVSRLTPFFEEQSAVALAATKNIRDHIENIMKGIDSLNLYVLKDVLIKNLKEGKSAPIEDPLTICQRVLWMDEELSVFVDLEEEFDFRDKDAFFKALSEHPQLIEQIFPTNRCIVGMATTRNHKDYESRGYSAFEAKSMRWENQATFLLIRDGGNIHVVASPYEWHRESKCLFPSQDDMDRPFSGVNGLEITYNDVQYGDRVKEFEDMARHYKQLLILLCGLDHRKAIFGEFYEGEPSLNFISLQFQESRFKFIYDYSGDGLIADQNRPEVFSKWLEHVNSEIRPGSKILVDWKTDAVSHRTMPGAFGTPHSPSSAYYPMNYHPVEPSRYLAVTVQKKGRELVAQVPVTGETFASYETRTFNALLNISKMLETNGRFICLDRVTPDELDYYLHDRASRFQSVDGIRLMRNANLHAQKRFEREQPLRAKLLEHVRYAGIANDESAMLSSIDKGMAVWRCANPNTDILTLLDDSKRYHELCDQISRVHNASNHLNMVLQAEESHGRVPIRVFVDAKGMFVALSEPLDADKDNRLEPYYWVARTRYTPSKRNVRPGNTSHVAMTKAQNNGQIIYERDDADDFLAPRNPLFESVREKTKLFTQAQGALQSIQKLKEIKASPELTRQLLSDYVMSKRELTDMSTSDLVQTFDYYIIPIGVGFYDYYHHSDKEPVMVVLSWSLDRLLAHLCRGNAELESEFIDAYSKYYRAEIEHRSIARRLLSEVDVNASLIDSAQIIFTNDKSIEANYPNFAMSGQQHSWRRDKVRNPHLMHTLVQSMLEDMARTEDKHKCFIVDDPASLDEALGAKKPEAFCPVEVKIPSLQQANDGDKYIVRRHPQGEKIDERNQYFPTLQQATDFLEKWQKNEHSFGASTVLSATNITLVDTEGNNGELISWELKRETIKS